MKALSIRQPWAWAILHAGKDVENRDWQPNGKNMRDARELLNSTILLHAGQALPSKDWTNFQIAYGMIRTDDATPSIPARHSLPLGGIVGMARIAFIIDSHIPPDDYSRIEQRRARQSRWFFGRYGLVLADTKPLPFIPWRGALGFFDVPDDVLPKEARTA